MLPATNDDLFVYLYQDKQVHISICAETTVTKVRCINTNYPVVAIATNTRVEATCKTDGNYTYVMYTIPSRIIIRGEIDNVLSLYKGKNAERI